MYYEIEKLYRKMRSGVLGFAERPLRLVEQNTKLRGSIFLYADLF